jgi:transcription antitermination factor NusG
VYVETVSAPDVDRIIRDVAFIRRRVAPEKVPLQEYEAILKVSDAPEILESSWARYTGRGDYCGDLVWVESYDPDAMSYVVYVVPRTLRWDAYKAKPAGLKRPRHPSRVTAALLLPSHVGLSCVADQLVQFDGSAYQHGFLVLGDVPARHLTDQDVVPSLYELDAWQQSPLYRTRDDIEILRLDSTVDSSYVSLASSFSESVRNKYEWLKTVCLVEEGDRVRIVRGEWKDMVGEAVNVDSTSRLVTVHITDFAGPSLDVPFPFAALMVDYRVGDFVEIRSGLHTGIRGWVDTIDWTTMRVGMLEYMYTPDATGKKTLTDAAAALEVRYIVCACKLSLTL